jgi:hypothetical protein
MHIRTLTANIYNSLQIGRDIQPLEKFFANKHKVMVVSSNVSERLLGKLTDLLLYEETDQHCHVLN